MPTPGEGTQHIRQRPFIIVPRSNRVVISVDVSPSMASVNSVTGVVVFEEVLHSLAQCLHALTAPFTYAGQGGPLPSPAGASQNAAAPTPDFPPERPIWLTLLVQTHPQLQPLHPVRVLLHGVLLTQRTLPGILAHVRTRLFNLEASLSATMDDHSNDLNNAGRSGACMRCRGSGACFQMWSL
jgi:hypothetical protein